MAHTATTIAEQYKQFLLQCDSDSDGEDAAGSAAKQQRAGTRSSARAGGSKASSTTSKAELKVNRKLAFIKQAYGSLPQFGERPDPGCEYEVVRIQDAMNPIFFPDGDDNLQFDRARSYSHTDPRVRGLLENLREAHWKATAPKGFAALKGIPELQQLLAYTAADVVQYCAGEAPVGKPGSFSSSGSSGGSKKRRSRGFNETAWLADGDSLIGQLCPGLRLCLAAEVATGLMCGGGTGESGHPLPPDTPQHASALLLFLAAAMHQVEQECAEVLEEQPGIISDMWCLNPTLDGLTTLFDFHAVPHLAVARQAVLQKALGLANNLHAATAASSSSGSSGSSDGEEGLAAGLQDSTSSGAAAVASAWLFGSSLWQPMQLLGAPATQQQQSQQQQQHRGSSSSASGQSVSAGGAQDIASDSSGTAAAESTDAAAAAAAATDAAAAVARINNIRLSLDLPEWKPHTAPDQQQQHQRQQYTGDSNSNSNDDNSQQQQLTEDPAAAALAQTVQDVMGLVSKFFDKHMVMPAVAESGAAAAAGSPMAAAAADGAAAAADSSTAAAALSTATWGSSSSNDGSDSGSSSSDGSDSSNSSSADDSTSDRWQHAGHVASSITSLVGGLAVKSLLEAYDWGMNGLLVVDPRDPTQLTKQGLAASGPQQGSGGPEQSSVPPEQQGRFTEAGDPTTAASAGPTAAPAGPTAAEIRAGTAVGVRLAAGGVAAVNWLDQAVVVQAALLSEQIGVLYGAVVEALIYNLQVWEQEHLPQPPPLQPQQQGEQGDKQQPGNKQQQEQQQGEKQQQQEGTDGDAGGGCSQQVDVCKAADCSITLSCTAKARETISLKVLSVITTAHRFRALVQETLQQATTTGDAAATAAAASAASGDASTPAPPPPAAPPAASSSSSNTFRPQATRELARLAQQTKGRPDTWFAGVFAHSGEKQLTPVCLHPTVYWQQQQQPSSTAADSSTSEEAAASSANVWSLLVAEFYGQAWVSALSDGAAGGADAASSSSTPPAQQQMQAAAAAAAAGIDVEEAAAVEAIAKAAKAANAAANDSSSNGSTSSSNNLEALAGVGQALRCFAQHVFPLLAWQRHWFGGMVKVSIEGQVRDYEFHELLEEQNKTVRQLHREHNNSSSNKQQQQGPGKKEQKGQKNTPEAADAAIATGVAATSGHRRRLPACKFCAHEHLAAAGVAAADAAADSASSSHCSYSRFPVSWADPCLMRRLLWNLLGRLKPSTQQWFATHAELCPHTNSSQLWGMVVRSIARHIWAPPGPWSGADAAQQMALVVPLQAWKVVRRLTYRMDELREKHVRTRRAHELNIAFHKQGSSAQTAAVLSLHALLALDPHGARVQPRPELLFYTPAGFHAAVCKTLMQALQVPSTLAGAGTKAKAASGGQQGWDGGTASSTAVTAAAPAVGAASNHSSPGPAATQQQQQQEEEKSGSQQTAVGQQLRRPRWSEPALPAWYMWWHIGLLAYGQQQQQYSMQQEAQPDSSSCGGSSVGNSGWTGSMSELYDSPEARLFAVGYAARQVDSSDQALLLLNNPPLPHGLQLSAEAWLTRQQNFMTCSNCASEFCRADKGPQALCNTCGSEFCSTLFCQSCLREGRPCTYGKEPAPRPDLAHRWRVLDLLKPSYDLSLAPQQQPSLPQQQPHHQQQQQPPFGSIQPYIPTADAQLLHAMIETLHANREGVQTELINQGLQLQHNAQLTTLYDRQPWGQSGSVAAVDVGQAAAVRSVLMALHKELGLKGLTKPPAAVGLPSMGSRSSSSNHNRSLRTVTTSLARKTPPTQLRLRREVWQNNQAQDSRPVMWQQQREQRDKEQPTEVPPDQPSTPSKASSSSSVRTSSSGAYGPAPHAAAAAAAAAASADDEQTHAAEDEVVAAAEGGAGQNPLLSLHLSKDGPGSTGSSSSNDLSLAVDVASGRAPAGVLDDISPTRAGAGDKTLLDTDSNSSVGEAEVIGRDIFCAPSGLQQPEQQEEETMP